MSTGRPLKLTVVGDPTVGKTCLLVAYVNHEFPQDYVPTVFDNYADKIDVDGEVYNLTLWDTAGQEDYERLRPLSYPNTDVFLLCYAIDNRTSFTHIEGKWIPELRHHCPNTPIVLLATKLDLRSASQAASNLISTADGRKLGKKIKAAKFLECSALSTENLDHVFQEAVRTALNPASVKRKCTFL